MMDDNSPNQSTDQSSDKASEDTSKYYPQTQSSWISVNRTATSKALTRNYGGLSRNRTRLGRVQLV